MGILLAVLAVGSVAAYYLFNRHRSASDEVPLPVPALRPSEIGLNSAIRDTKASRNFRSSYSKWLEGQSSGMTRQLFAAQGGVLLPYFGSLVGDDDEANMSLWFTYCHGFYWRGTP